MLADTEPEPVLTDQGTISFKLQRLKKRQKGVLSIARHFQDSCMK